MTALGFNTNTIETVRMQGTASAELRDMTLGELSHFLDSLRVGGKIQGGRSEKGETRLCSIGQDGTVTVNSSTQELHVSTQMSKEPNMFTKEPSHTTTRATASTTSEFGRQKDTEAAFEEDAVAAFQDTARWFASTISTIEQLNRECFSL